MCSKLEEVGVEYAVVGTVSYITGGTERHCDGGPVLRARVVVHERLEEKGECLERHW